MRDCRIIFVSVIDQHAFHNNDRTADLLLSYKVHVVSGYNYIKTSKKNYRLGFTMPLGFGSCINSAVSFGKYGVNISGK